MASAQPPPIQGYASGAAGELFGEALVALAAVLEAAGETEWHRLVLADLSSWRTSGGTVGQRRAHGGMGTLADLTLAGDVWLDACFVQLRTLTGVLAGPAGDDPARWVQHRGTAPAGVAVVTCRRCGARGATAAGVVGAAATGWAGYAVPHLVSSGRGADVVAAATGDAEQHHRAAYLAHVGAALEAQGVRIEADVALTEVPCPCGAAAERRVVTASVF